MKNGPIILAAAAFAALGGCAASIPPVEVTRFHLGAPIARGTIVVANTAVSLEDSTYQAVVARELARVGYPAGDAASARYTFSAVVTRDTREALIRRSPLTIGIGGGTGGYGGGVGLGASFGVGGNRNREVVITQLAVRLAERGTGATVWEGRAETEAASNAPAAQPGLAADKLAKALFRDFPGESGRTIRVP